MYALSPACGVWHAAPRARRNRCRSVPLATADNDTASPPQAPSCSSSRRAALLLAATAATTVAAPPPPAYAGLSSYDVTGKGIANASMALGAKDSNDFAFLPSELSFTQGQVTKLKLTNPSQVEHYFSAREFASKVFTIAVESNGVEVKGAVTEVALEPGASLTWIFVPMKAGTYQLLCPVPGHIEGGMVGVLTVVAAR